MNALGVVAGGVVGIAFVVAGASKLAAGRGWPVQAAGMGVPTPVAKVVPYVELAVGAVAAVQLWHPWPVLAALVLLAAFTTLIAAQLAAGRRPVCACFGAWSARPIGAGHLARNAILAALALVAVVA